MSWNSVLNMFCEMKNRAMEKGIDLWAYDARKETCVDYWARMIGEEKYEKVNQIEKIYESVLEENQCVSLKTLAVSGKDLITGADMQPGRELGEMLQYLLELVVENPELNHRETLLKEAAEKKNKVQ